jgi:hypothetical protein
MKLKRALVSAVRDALAHLPDVAAQETLAPPDLSQVFVPQQHLKALSLDSSVVVGMRGAGKSFWTAVLPSEIHRNFVASLSKQTALSHVIARVGFGLDESEQQFPNADTIARILAAGGNPYRLWQTVVLRHARSVLRLPPWPPTPKDWESAVSWTTMNPNDADEHLSECDLQLSGQGRTLLVLFDAFDRLSSQNNWSEVRALTLEALRLCLRCRSRRSIRLKEIWKFPDSSKLRHAKVELTWRSTDLYALILMHLANSTSVGREFRRWITDELGLGWTKPNPVYVLPTELTGDEDSLRFVVQALADEHMGRDRKRGITYTWVPTHLADAVGRISPRSYLLAFCRAAERTAEQYPNHPMPLHYTAIQEGVIAASEIRVREITEDYPWVEPLLEAARGLVVPCAPGELTRAWTPARLQQVSAASKRKLPPKRYATDPFRRGSVEALMDDLVELAVLYRTEDGRVNMPDIFRVGFGIKRRGGVKPPL